MNVFSSIKVAFVLGGEGLVIRNKMCPGGCVWGELDTL